MGQAPMAMSATHCLAQSQAGVTPNRLEPPSLPCDSCPGRWSVDARMHAAGIDANEGQAPQKKKKKKEQQRYFEASEAEAPQPVASNGSPEAASGTVGQKKKKRKPDEAASAPDAPEPAALPTPLADGADGGTKVRETITMHIQGALPK